MSELFDIQVNAQKESLKKYFWGSHSRKPTKKCAMKVKETKKKRQARKNVIDGRKHFIGHLHKTGEDDWDKLRANDSGYSEGTICLVNG